MENCFWCSIRKENEGNVKRAIQQSKNQIKIKPINPDMNQKIFCYNHIHKGNTSPVPITLEKTKDRFKEDNPDWKSKLLSVPIANIKTVKFPRHKILEDAKEHLKDKYKKLSEEKKSFLNGLKLDVENIVLKSENKELPGQISENIAEKILKPNVKDKTKALETLKQELKRVINSAIVNHTNQTDLIDNIYGIIEKRVLKGIEEEIVGSSDYGSMILRKGEEAELLVKEKIEEAVRDNSALVMNGFKVWEYTNQALANIGVNLKTATKKSEVEHDIMLMTTHQLQPQVHLTFVQVKDPDIRPWHEEGCEDSEERKKNFEKLASKALKQTVKDITAFFEMFPDLTEEEADNISFDCFAALPNSTGEGLCPNCKVKILTKEVFEDVDKLRSTLKIGTSEMADGAQDLYSKIASRYIGAGSLVPLKTLGDYYKEVAKQIDDVETQMKRCFKEAPEDQTNIELALKLSDVQHSAVTHSGSKILCGPHGSGKTILLLLAVAKKIQEFKDRGMKTKACLIVWERSQELKKKFNDFAKQYEGDEDIIVKVVFKDEIFKENGIENDDDDRVEEVNKLMVKLEQLGWQIIAIDEIKIINDFSKDSLKNWLIKIKSWFTEVVVSDWSKLSPPASTTLFLSFQPVMSLLGNAALNLSLPPVTEVTGPPTMPVFTLQQVFRSTTKIHQLLQSLHRDRDPSVQEAWCRVLRGVAGRFQDNPSCVMDPGEEERGHGITGIQPTWTILPRCSHFVCDDAVGCFLEKNKPKIRQHLQELLDIYDREDVTIVLDVGGNEAAKRWFKDELNTERVFSVQEFVGGETQALLFLQKGEYTNPSKYNGWSRATSHLTVVTDDTFTETYWELQAAKDNFQGDPQTPDPPSTASCKRTLARIFARHTWDAFIGNTLLSVLSLLFMFLPLVVASLLHGNFPLLINRLVDRRGGGLRFWAVFGWTLCLCLIIVASPYHVTGGLVYWLVINVATTVANTTQLSSIIWRTVEMVPGGIVFTVAIIILLPIFMIIEGMKWIYSKIRSMNAVQLVKVVIGWIVWYYNYEVYEVDLF